MHVSGHNDRHQPSTISFPAADAETTGADHNEEAQTDADSEEAATDFTSGSRPCPCCLQEATGEYSILKYRVTHRDG